MSLDQLIELAKAHGVEGIIVALVVLVGVYVAKYSGLVKSGNAARIVNVILAIVFSGYKFGDDASGFVAAIASLGSALLFTFLKWAAGKVTPAKKS